MKRIPSRIPVVVTAALLLCSPAAFAQSHDRGRPSHERSGESRGPAVERAQPRASAPRAEAPRAEAPRNESRAQIAPRVEDRRGPRVEGRAVPRGEVAPRYESRGSYAPRYDGRYAPRYEPRYAPRYYSSRVYVRPYVFRPRVRVGFGIYVGYPVAYTYAYPYPIAVYGYGAPVGPVVVNPGSTAYGGVALEINPPDAAVYVDGAYAGVVADFDGTRQPLTLVYGRHRIEVNAPGCAPLIFDVDVAPGQVIPYRGDLQPY